MIRLFIALIIPEEAKNQIIQIRKSIYPDEDNLRWEDKSKLHLTLIFIGEVKDELLEPISQELNFLENFNKINCTAKKFGFFFKQKNEPRILWLGLNMDDSIHSIVDELNNRLSKFLIPIEERKFKAHLTLLRIKRSVSQDFVDKFSNAELPNISFIANEIILMQSKLSSQGSTYKEIKKYNLK
jgi:RNA 2',3'-cyclic 3'-phosphodiesterase